MSREAYPDLIETLSNFSTTSFTELQAAAYIALLEMGEESGSAVASQSGINRSKIYDILGQLEDMGAVKKVSRNGRSRYVAVTPDDLLPGLVEKFSRDINTARQALNSIKNLEEEVDAQKFTLTSIDLAELDTNKYQYLISSNEKSRVMLTEKLDKDHRPSTGVKILNLNDDSDHRGLILLINTEEAYLFGTPAGVKVDAIHITSKEITKFLLFVIEASWTSDLPDFVMEEIELGSRNALVIDKALNVHYELYATNQEYKYNRPITLLITDEHISFFYEEMEELKIPLVALSNVHIVEGNFIKVEFSNQKGKVGDLEMTTVGNPYYIKNILNLIKTIN